MPVPSIPEPTSLVQAIPQLEGEAAAEPFLQGSGFSLLIWGAIALVLLAAVGTLWWVRRRARALPPAPTPLETALLQLRELGEQLPPLRECGLRVSLIIRSFLQGSVQDPALYETHEEFSRRIDALVSVPEECRYDTRNLLERLADLKYAGAAGDDPARARSLIEQATALLSRIEATRRQSGANTAPTTPHNA